MPNQWKPNPPLSFIEEPLRNLWKRTRLTDRQILNRLKARYIPSEYGLGITRFREMRDSLGLTSARKSGHTLDSITSYMIVLRQQYPHAGREDLKKLLFDEHNIRVPRSLIQEWCKKWKPDLVRSRRHNKMRRKAFYAAGCNDIWTCDQHDKFKKYGIGLHVCVDSFTGQVIWLKAWWGNRNPRLIFSYYLEAVRSRGYTCMVTQSDPGSENWGFAKGHTYIRHCLDPSLTGTIQHRWYRIKKNVMPEIFWSGLRRRWAPGFENILNAPESIEAINYDRADPLQYNIFKWLFIPWLQFELDGYKNRINTSTKRKQRGKVTPQGGPPDDIEENPEEYACLNFKLKIAEENCKILDQAEQLFAPPDHPTFELVPRAFNAHICACYAALGSPDVTRLNIWRIYSDLLALLQADEAVDLTSLKGFPTEEEDANDTVDAEYLAELDRQIKELQELPEEDESDKENESNGNDSQDKDFIDVFVDGFTDDEDDE